MLIVWSNRGLEKRGYSSLPLFPLLPLLPFTFRDIPHPRVFCVSRGNKGVTGEIVDVGETKGVAGAERRWGEDKGVGRSEMAQEQRPLQHNGWS